MFAVRMLAAVALVLLSTVGSTIVNEELLCGSFSGTFEKTTKPQTLKIYAGFVPSNVTIGLENIKVQEVDCASKTARYACRLIQVHESGFWRFEIDGVVTAHVDSILLFSDLPHHIPVAIQALPLSDKCLDNIFLQASAPFVLCPSPQEKGVPVDFVFPASTLDRAEKVSVYRDGFIQWTNGQDKIKESVNVMHDGTNTVLTVSLTVTRFQNPSKRYRTVSAVVTHEGQEKILTKIVDFGSTVWEPLCETYDGTFSFVGPTTNVMAYLPFKPQQIIMGGSRPAVEGQNYTFIDKKCEGGGEVLDCKLTAVRETNVFKFEMYNVIKADIHTILFRNSDAKHSQPYILYRKDLTDVEQFLFSPKYSQPFVHCPSPSSNYADIRCAFQRSSNKHVRVVESDTVICEENSADYPKCVTNVPKDRKIVYERVYHSPKMGRFVYVTCEFTSATEKGYMTHLIDFGRKDAYEIYKDDIEETWASLDNIYSGTYQLNSQPDFFYAFMDFKPKYFSNLLRMDGEYCLTSRQNFTCKIRKVIGSLFWRVEIWPDISLTENALSFRDDRHSPKWQYAMYSTPLSETTEGFVRNLSQPFVHHATDCGIVSIKCVFRHKMYSKQLQFRVYTKHRTVCIVHQRESSPCEIIFDAKADTATVTVNVNRQDINEERYGIFTCENEQREHLYHLVDFGSKRRAV